IMTFFPLGEKRPFTVAIDPTEKSLPFSLTIPPQGFNRGPQFEHGDEMETMISPDSKPCELTMKSSALRPGIRSLGNLTLICVADSERTLSRGSVQRRMVCCDSGSSITTVLPEDENFSPRMEIVLPGSICRV